MSDDVNNKSLQQIIFVTSLVLVITGLGMIITKGLSKIFEFKDTFITQPLTTKQQPFAVIFLFALAALYFSWRNLQRIRVNKKGKV